MEITKAMQIRSFGQMAGPLQFPPSFWLLYLRYLGGNRIRLKRAITMKVEEGIR